MGIGFGTRVILTILLAGVSTITSGIFERLSLDKVLGLTETVQEPVWTVEQIADSVATTGANEAYSILFESLSKLKKASKAQPQGSNADNPRLTAVYETSRHCNRTYARVSRMRRSTLARMKKFQAGLETHARDEERETLRLLAQIEGQRLVSTGDIPIRPELQADLELSIDRQAQLMRLNSMVEELVGQFDLLFEIIGDAVSRETDYRRRRGLEDELHTKRSISPPQPIESDAWDILNMQRQTERELVDILYAMGAYPADSDRLKSTGRPNWIEITALIVQIELERQSFLAPVG